MTTGIEGAAKKVLMDPKSLERAYRGVRTVISEANEIERAISGGLDIETRIIEISCPESIGIYQLIFKPRIGLINNTFKFKAGNILDATVHGIQNFSKQPQAIRLSESGDATINLKELEQGALYSARFTYRIENDFLNDLVFTRREQDSPDDDQGRYWMTAGLKCPEVLRQHGYSRIDINDMDFSVDVNINNEINNAVPRAYKEQIELLAKLAGPRPGRDEWVQTTHRLYRLKGEKYGNKELDLLSTLLELFSPTQFRRFVNVDGQFYYKDCIKGTSAYDLPINIWPKFMTIVSRTGLTLENPVSQGSLIYKKHEFMDEVHKRFK